MTEKIISYKKYIEPIPEKFESIDFIPENHEEPIPIKTNHNSRKIKKKAKTDNNIYDDILVSNVKVTDNTENTEVTENVKVTENTENVKVRIETISPTIVKLTSIPRVVKLNPRGVIKKKKGH